MTEERAREALATQGFRTPGPLLIALVEDALARRDAESPAGIRTYPGLDPVDFLRDTPELVDRTLGPLTNPSAEAVQALADVLCLALNHEPDED